MDELDQSEQSHAMALYYRRLVHSRYVKDTEEYNNLHHDAMTNPVSMLIYRLLTQAADENLEGCRSIIGFETGTWVSNEHYEMVMAFAELIKLEVLTRIPEKEIRAKAEANWFLNDTDEKGYM
ncbi:hypothetical protein E4T56_gene17017 [Termitomyces sp. T112]|nr:hypothetical protein E4T56_gene17017 [Termitomyces sp. T112]